MGLLRCPARETGLQLTVRTSPPVAQGHKPSNLPIETPPVAGRTHRDPPIRSPP